MNDYTAKMPENGNRLKKTKVKPADGKDGKMATLEHIAGMQIRTMYNPYITY